MKLNQKTWSAVLKLVMRQGRRFFNDSAAKIFSTVLLARVTCVLAPLRSFHVFLLLLRSEGRGDWHRSAYGSRSWREESRGRRRGRVIGNFLPQSDGDEGREDSIGSGGIKLKFRMLRGLYEGRAKRCRRDSPGGSATMNSSLRGRG